MDIFVFVYLDDIYIFSHSLDSHSLHVRQVVQRLLENKLFVKAEKCEFHRNSVSFLGFIVTPSQVKMDPSKLKAVWTGPPRLPDVASNSSWGLPIFAGGSSEITVP